MSIVIRPSPDVFRRKLPLLLVFGACREGDGAGDFREEAALADLVAEARSYRVPIGFCRPVGDSDSRRAWLPGCRPTIRDMVFDIAGRSCFESPDVERALKLRATSGLCLSGLSEDALLRASIADAVTRETRVSVLDLSGALQKRSTLNDGSGDMWALAAVARLGYLVSRGTWLAGLRNRMIEEGCVAR